MIVTHVELTNVRSISTAEFRFIRGFNLIVGINGVGKTTTLEALRECLSQFVRFANHHGLPVEYLRKDAVRVGARALDVACEFEHRGNPYRYVSHVPSNTNAQGGGRRRREFIDAPGLSAGHAPLGRPLAVLYSANRSVPVQKWPTSIDEWRKPILGIKYGFTKALSDRELRLGEIAAWLRVQQALSKERRRRVLQPFEDAVRRFLPGYENLHVGGDDGRSLLVDHEGATLPLRQLSDGERGILALILDLARRLSQANPRLEDPIATAEAVVLIDELELHLHPKWQRQIVHKLTATFPRCQFATTHSPQVIGEVSHERIHIMADGQVYSPTHSFGVDSSRVLDEVMDADSRTQKVTRLLAELSQEIGAQRFDGARALLTRLVEHLGEADPEVTRLQTLLDFLEGKD